MLQHWAWLLPLACPRHLMDMQDFESYKEIKL
jgi:hypothetical protein